MMLILTLQACKRERANFPPDDTGVELTSTNLPIVWIEVGARDIDRYRRIDARMKIIDNGQGNLNYADTVSHPGQRIDYAGHIALRYRGNSTYNDSPKKPYSFRTMDGTLKYGSKKKVKILGMGKDDNWALMAPYSDKSMMRDMLTYELMRPWMEYTPQGRYCEVFLNGTYYGVYILCEVVSKGKHRLNLDKPGKHGDVLTGDYLMEVDCNDEPTYTSHYHPVSSKGVPYKDKVILIQYKSPDLEELNERQLAYINGRINQMEAAFASPSYRFKMVIWDTNLAYGNTKNCDGWRTDTWIYQSNDVLYGAGEVYLVPFWWYRLNSDPDYVAAVKERWAQMRAANLSESRIMATVDSLATLLTSHGAEARNSQAWPRWGQYVWPNYYIAKDYQDEVAYLKQWLHERLAWMDEQLGYVLDK